MLVVVAFAGLIPNVNITIFESSHTYIVDATEAVVNMRGDYNQ